MSMLQMLPFITLYLQPAPRDAVWNKPAADIASADIQLSFSIFVTCELIVILFVTD